MSCLKLFNHPIPGEEQIISLLMEQIIATGEFSTTRVLTFMWSTGRKLLAASAPAASPTVYPESGISPTYAKQRAVESDLVVVLAAMICALICALGLNSAVSCAIRCGRRMGMDPSDIESIRLANTGVKKAAMEAMPTIVYTSVSILPPGLATDCSICLAEFRGEEKLRVLPQCNHGFHIECIDKWLTSHSSCPICRHSLNPRRPAVAQLTQSRCNASHVVIDTTDLTQGTLPGTETLERIPREATEVMTVSPLSLSSVSENQSS